MMAGSLYAIVMGPTTLETALPPLSFGTFHILACELGLALVLGLQLLKEKTENS